MILDNKNCSLDASTWRSQSGHLARAHVLHFVAVLFEAALLFPSQEALAGHVIKVFVPIFRQKTDKKAGHK